MTAPGADWRGRDAGGSGVRGRNRLERNTIEQSPLRPGAGPCPSVTPVSRRSRIGDRAPGAVPPAIAGSFCAARQSRDVDSGVEGQDRPQASWICAGGGRRSRRPCGESDRGEGAGRAGAGGRRRTPIGKPCRRRSPRSRRRWPRSSARSRASAAERRRRLERPGRRDSARRTAARPPSDVFRREWLLYGAVAL